MKNTPLALITLMTVVTANGFAAEPFDQSIRPSFTFDFGC